MSLRSMVSASSFSEKLRLTAAALNCYSQKDLAAAFHAINPRTDFTVARSYKWTQGRTIPRSSRLYDDWAKLLDLDRSAQDLLTCTVDEFRSWIDGRHGSSHRPHSEGAAQADQVSSPGQIAVQTGRFACYFRDHASASTDRIIRASLTIQTPRGALAPTAHFAAAPSRGRASGTVRTYGQTACLEMRHRVPGRAPTYIAFSDPSASGSVLVGVMLTTPEPGAAYRPPLAAHLVAIRITDGASVDLHATNRLLEANESVAADLSALGLENEAVRRLEALVRSVLADPREASAACPDDTCRYALAAPASNPAAPHRQVTAAGRTGKAPIRASL